ncbi:MAG TPA: hypothetical protein VGE16_00405 [Albitalea sp.]
MHTRDQSFLTPCDLSPMQIAARPVPSNDMQDAGAVEYASWMDRIRGEHTPPVDRSVIEFFCPDRLRVDASGPQGS